MTGAQATRNEELNLLGYIIMIVVMVVLILGVWITKSHFEAKAYNRITGSEVSTADAMFVQLRVDGSSK